MSKLETSDIQEIIEVSNTYYQSKRTKFSNLTKAYTQELFDSTTISWGSSEQIIIEPPAGYSFVEGYMASLFSKAPAVIVGQGPTADGDKEVVEAVCNSFLYDKSEALERLMRYAIIYPFAFIKLGLREANSVIEQVDMKAIYPWDVIIDFDAETIEDCRYLGHHYWLSTKDAKAKFPGRIFDATIKKNFLDEPNVVKPAAASNSGMLSYVEVYEIYDFINDELIFWSPNAKRTDKILDRVNPIPFRKSNGNPLCPLVPLYFGYSPSIPLQGASLLQRIYPMLYEKINLRSQWANSIRKDARIWVTRKGAFDEESKAILAENRDGSVIELQCPADVDARTLISPLVGQTMSTDFSVYENKLDQDLNAGSVLAPFTRGIATNVSATEIAALTQYSASEIGKLARMRDRAIEVCAESFCSLIAHLLMTGDVDKEVVTIAGKTHVLQATDFTAKFKFASADQNSTPVSSVIDRQNFMQVLPLLQQMSVPNNVLLEKIVSLYNLPPNFLDGIQAPVPQQAVGLPQVPTSEPSQPTGLDIGGGAEALAIRNSVSQGGTCHSTVLSC